MKKLYIIKIGSTFAATAEKLGDFDAWVSDGLGAVDIDTCILDVEHGEDLPSAENCAGVVMTGSHAMVTEDLPWSIRVEAWLPSLLEGDVPFLGICYGHQLLARSMGGNVGFHPGGKEVGTVEIHLVPDYTDDALFRSMPERFHAHVTHAQTVLSLPPGAVRLAANTHEPNHAFRIGHCAWGVQFHPEFDAAVMRTYIREQADELQSSGRDVPELLHTVVETPVSAQMLKNFGAIVNSGKTNSSLAAA